MMRTEEEISPSQPPALQDTGGNAYPMVLDTANSWHFETGMTLRDYFAAQAMTAHIHASSPDNAIAKWSYATADAMLSERNKPKEESK